MKLNYFFTVLALCFCLSNSFGQRADNNQATEEKNLSSVSELLQGVWQSVDDNTNFLMFDGNERKETAGAIKNWSSEAFTLSDRCVNDMDEDLSPFEPSEGRYLSCEESDLCWYIYYVDYEYLTLIFTARGNSLRYKRVE